jgi:hypothetical protein
MWQPLRPAIGVKSLLGLLPMSREARGGRRQHRTAGSPSASPIPRGKSAPGPVRGGGSGVLRKAAGMPARVETPSSSCQPHVSAPLSHTQSTWFHVDPRAFKPEPA